MKEIESARKALRDQFEGLEDKKSILRAPVLKALFDGIREVEPEKRGAYGKAINELKNEVQSWVDDALDVDEEVMPLDITAPSDVNAPLPTFIAGNTGTEHPLTTEIRNLCDIFQRMGFAIEESREIDDDFHMFSSLNFPEDHPARDDYDTFMTDDGLVAPAHTSTMQNRVLQKYRENLDKGEPIAVVVPDRVFRNEELDARHEHTFYQ